MQCPGCGDELKAVSIAGFDYSYRCEKCGGVWAANWVVNNLASGKPVQLEPVRAKLFMGLGGNVCPTDGAKLVSPVRGSIPEGMVVEKCNQCGWWWFPGDEVFKFADAFKTKVAYVRVWERREWIAYAWPALVLLVMVMGLATSVNLVKDRQSSAITAGVGISEFVVIPWSVGRVEIRFKSDSEVSTLDYKMRGARVFKTVGLKRDGEVYTVTLDKLTRGDYVVVVLGREFEMHVN